MAFSSSELDVSSWTDTRMKEPTFNYLITRHRAAVLHQFTTNEWMNRLPIEESELIVNCRRSHICFHRQLLLLEIIILYQCTTAEDNKWWCPFMGLTPKALLPLTLAFYDVMAVWISYFPNFCLLLLKLLLNKNFPVGFLLICIEKQ